MTVSKTVGQGSSPCARAIYAGVAQTVERILGKDEVTSSILVAGSILQSRPFAVRKD